MYDRSRRVRLPQALFKVAKSNRNQENPSVQEIGIWLHGCKYSSRNLQSCIPAFVLCMWTSCAECDAARHHQAWHFIMLSRRGTIINDECQQRRSKTNNHLKKQDAWLRLLSDDVFPSLSSVVVLYTQGVESKQWREVRDHSCPCQHKSISLPPLHMTARSLFTTLPSSLSLSLSKCCECQSFAIDWSCECPCVLQHCVNRDWLAD